MVFETTLLALKKNSLPRFKTSLKPNIYQKHISKTPHQKA